MSYKDGIVVGLSKNKALAIHPDTFWDLVLIPVAVVGVSAVLIKNKKVALAVAGVALGGIYSWAWGQGTRPRSYFAPLNKEAIDLNRKMLYLEKRGLA